MNPSSGKIPATTISFTIYGQRFQLLAAPEEHERIRRVAEAVDAQIQSQRERAASELRSILMAAYQIGYELDEIEGQARAFTETQQQLAQVEQTLQNACDTADRLIERIDRETAEEAVPETEWPSAALPVETVQERETPPSDEEILAPQPEILEVEDSEPVPEPPPEASPAEEMATPVPSEAVAFELSAFAEPKVVSAAPSFEEPSAALISESPVQQPETPESEAVAPEPFLTETVEPDEPEPVPVAMPPSFFEEPVMAEPEPIEPEVPVLETSEPAVPAVETIVEPELEPSGPFAQDVFEEPAPEQGEAPLEELPSSRDRFEDIDLPTPQAEEVAPAPSDTVPEVAVFEETAEPWEPPVVEAAPRMEPEVRDLPATPSFTPPSVQDLWGAPRPAATLSPSPEEPVAVSPEALDSSEADLAEMEMRLPDIEMDLADVEFGIQVDEPFELDSTPESGNSDGPLFGFPSAPNHLPTVEAGWPDVESFQMDEPKPAAPMMEPFDRHASVSPASPSASPIPEVKPFEFHRPPQPQPPQQPQIRPNPLRTHPAAPVSQPSSANWDKHPHAQTVRPLNPATRPPETTRLFESPGRSRDTVPPLAKAQDTRVRPSGSPEFKTIGAKPWMGGATSPQAKPFETRNFLFGNPDKKTPAKPPIFHDVTEKKPRNVTDDVQPSLFPYLDERLKKPDPKSNP